MSNDLTIRMIDKRRGFAKGIDGKIYVRVDQFNGQFDAHALRMIADELDRRNAGCDAIVELNKEQRNEH